MAEDTALIEVPTLHKPVPELVDELEELLDAARAGTLRGVLFVSYSHGGNNYRYGLAGQYSLPEFAMGLKLMAMEFDSIVAHKGIREG